MQGKRAVIPSMSGDRLRRRIREYNLSDETVTIQELITEADFSAEKR
jgi:hypothetical protein